LNNDELADVIDAKKRALIALKREPNCSIFIDENGFVDCCSDKFARLIGIADDRAVRGKHFCELYRLFSDSETLIEGAKNAFEEIRTKRAAQEKTLKLHFPADNEKRSYIVQSVPLFDENDAFIGAKASFIDATNLAICAASENARFLLDQAPIGCTLRDRDNRVIDCNAEVIRMFGATDKADFISRFSQFYSQYQPDGSPSDKKRREMIDECAEKGRSQCEWLYVNAAGEPMLTDVVVIRADWKGDYRYLVYCRDLREIKAKEENERRANERARAMLDATPIACVFFDGAGRAIDCNLEATRLFETSKEELLERFFYFAPELQPNGQATLEQKKKYVALALEEGECVFEWMHATATGRDLPALVTLKRMNWRGDGGLSAYIQDLREIKYKDKSAREAEEIPLALLNAAPIAALLWDDNLRLIDCNTEALCMFGFTHKRDLIESLSALLAKNESESLSEVFQEGYGKFNWNLTTRTLEPLPTEAILARVPWHDGYRVAAYLRDLR
jgi:PAS domain S-box-containing protein